MTSLMYLNRSRMDSLLISYHRNSVLLIRKELLLDQKVDDTMTSAIELEYCAVVNNSDVKQIVTCVC